MVSIMDPLWIKTKFQHGHIYIIIINRVALDIRPFFISGRISVSFAGYPDRKTGLNISKNYKKHIPEEKFYVNYSGGYPVQPYLLL